MNEYFQFLLDRGRQRGSHRVNKLFWTCLDCWDLCVRSEICKTNASWASFDRIVLETWSASTDFSNVDRFFHQLYLRHWIYSICIIQLLFVLISLEKSFLFKRNCYSRWFSNDIQNESNLLEKRFSVLKILFGKFFEKLSMKQTEENIRSSEYRK
jgi:hypothetical protein